MSDSRAHDRETRSGLRELLLQLDGLPYDAYRRLLGSHALEELSITFDRIPADPFVGPARVRLAIDRSAAGLPPTLAEGRARRIAVEDFVATRAAGSFPDHLGKAENAPRGVGQAGLAPPGPCILERSTCRITESSIELRLGLDLPAARRRVRGRQAEDLLFNRVHRFGLATLLFPARRVEEAGRFADAAEDHASLQAAMAARGLVAFFADGSRPVKDSWESPESLRVSLDLPQAGTVDGLGIPAGITVVVGGRGEGKSAFLRALAAAVHPHRPGSGLERSATVPGAVVVRSEPGRPVRGVDLSGFLYDGAEGRRVSCYTCESADGCVSQAASIVEAIEAGARLLIVDEDDADASLLVRDGRMQRLVPGHRPGPVSLLDRAREIYDRYGVSIVVATGGVGDYLEVADTVMEMKDGVPRERTADAREIVTRTRSARLDPKVSPLRELQPRVPAIEDARDSAGWKVGVYGSRGIRIADEIVSLSAPEHLVEPGQLRALAPIVREAASRMRPGMDLPALLDDLDAWLDRESLDALDPPAAYDLARPRRFEIAAAINRWKRVKVVRSHE